MFAKGYKRVVDVYHELMDDPMISSQGIIVRDFVPLENLEISISGLPFSNEHRFFFYKKTMLTNFFYWSNSEKVGLLDDEGMSFAKKIADIISDHVDFFVIDIAKTQAGDWILIEINDGQMSGIVKDDIKMNELYLNLKNCCE